MSKSGRKYQALEETDLLGTEMGDIALDDHNASPLRPVGQTFETSVPQGRMDSGRGTAPSSTGMSTGTGEAAMSAVLPSFLRNAAHPYVCFFHLLFKSLAVVTYWIIYLITKDIILTFVFTTVFLALDFWTVKNVTGRLLVGLRWWNQANPDGTTEWVFESAPRDQPSSLDRNVFWIALFAFPTYWSIAAVSNILSFSPNFVVLNLMGIAFSATNAIGYSKCSRSGRQQVQNWASNQMMTALASNIVNSVNAAGSTIKTASNV